VDTITLVERRIDDGRRLIGLLSQKDIDVTAAAWVPTSENGNWFLYIATEEVDKSGQATAYAKVYNVLRNGPETTSRFSRNMLSSPPLGAKQGGGQHGRLCTGNRTE